jgi:GH25 family lysozyme M1 (1,4-beta-N-acetylmuramidase)
MIAVCALGSGWFMLFIPRFVVAASACLFASLAFAGGPFTEPWRDQNRALVIDGYEHNSIDWAKLANEKRVVGFINKATDGVGEPWNCTNPDTSLEVCRLKFRRYFVAQELYQTRRMLAKSLGMKWGSYHLGRKGNPIAQADHYLDMAKPTDDEVMALDIEGLEDKWMSLEDAQKFVVRIHDKTGRWPMLYVNGSTAKHIADNRADYRILSRLNLWYARFSPEIDGHFPKGNWDKYDLWQFSATPNCNDRRCPQRVAGTPNDIDVNVADMTPEALRAAWPMHDLVAEKPLPVQPLEVSPVDEPLLVAAAPSGEPIDSVQIPAQKPIIPMIDVALVPLPNAAPRDNNERPKTVFVAMANIFGADAMAFISKPGQLHGTAEIFALFGVTKAHAEPQIDMSQTVSIPRIWPDASKLLDAREATRVIAPQPSKFSGPN